MEEVGLSLKDLFSKFDLGKSSSSNFIKENPMTCATYIKILRQLNYKLTKEIPLNRLESEIQADIIKKEAGNID